MVVQCKVTVGIDKALVGKSRQGLGVELEVTVGKDFVGESRQRLGDSQVQGDNKKGLNGKDMDWVIVECESDRR